MNSAFFDRNLAQTTPFPFGIKVSKAEGVWIYDDHGNRLMDLISGVGVSNLGHGQPKVIQAIKNQADSYLHVMVYGEYLQAPQTLLAERLIEILPSQLDCCYFVNSGAEAIEAALKLAKRVTGRTRIISARGAYHGSTHGAMSVSGNELKKRAFRPLLPDVHFVAFNDHSALESITKETACILLETIQGDAGIRIPDAKWLQAIRTKCTETGTLLILDEIQAGMGRTGKNFAFEHFGIEPDILVLGKALGGGLPIGACVANKSHMEQFTTNPMLGHITTFGGHPLVCAAAAAGIEVLTKEVDFEEVVKVADYFRERLTAHPKVKEVRNKGLFFAIDMDNEEEVQHVVNFGLANGFIGFWFLSCPASFRIAPPLVTTMEEAEWACNLMHQAFDALP
ncbi:MAG: aspartate aminotransferase family protein [Flavobacteriales bacterium]|nr:aspartate aminotransferase family protein [Flavobacteriales bacterium]MDG2247153.1 aspartate aminotransferase family protein [Flavobacteriales bacterium]